MVTDGQHGCQIIRVLSGRWMLPILGALADGAARPSELERRLSGAPHAIVMRRLKDLTACGAAVSVRSAGRPPSVRYTLTQAGQELLAIAAHAAAWERRFAEPPAEPRRPETW
jgi:DNA-binding HxlR family transcriptional regulator